MAKPKVTSVSNLKFAKEPELSTTDPLPERESTYSLKNIWIVSFTLKALLVVGYHSTDFDVHRNWLAITHNLPISKWYVENTSQWTLDYPPFFAYFEWFLSQMVPDFVKRDGCLDIVEKGQYGLPTVYFQRLTVIVSELVLFYALQWMIDSSPNFPAKRRTYVAVGSLALSPGLLIIDHMHFQYNGMMYGILLLCLNCARLKRYLMCGFWFSVLLCFKHIYLYLAPAVFVFLLRAYCLKLNYNKKRNVFVNLISFVQWGNLLKLGSVVIAVFTIAFLPFIYYGVGPNLISRLFPFSRGLTHAYWAPNVWAIYSFADRFLIQIYKRIPISRYPLQRLFQFVPELLENDELLKSSTRGIVGDIEFFILPTITPKLTFLLTFFYQIMSLIPLFVQPNYRRFIGALTLCGYASFLFGWHVHEKAILIVIFPMTLLVARDRKLLAPYSLLVACGYGSLFPLIYTSNEWLVKVLYTLLWYIIFYFNLRKVVPIPKKFEAYGGGGIILDRVINGYILGFIVVVTFTSLLDLLETRYTILQNFKFLNLMIYSVYCGVGIISSWNGFYWLYFVDESIWSGDDV
ncbi:Dolichyl pyrophosphate Glc1Man9GlcNAc2 alpha-1,3-glucosyltransferase [Spathaspora passalidarum NRRL Y-27907]|uniref:Alpha-1,3-glucosyltransferase n=1 Tax=Spathaspora passalidarum (strain NRRL Y-27907 / 11-Y1) TaxID=619300 RepID=G3AQ92_SPAPN|nr:Dolichyl pyrophosphate Glc1Man9GlcNAc2 alpha-1,3-glucosyltransferase [Spathaspora passalidarum NRRL Y-27907]EGW31439.1 Dolichyl pyrophosphate Glc1Man9GlcNAc2 alpha-1,3-glucosyltransferase [Spathaspora passalidarum NRRL Y-27907]